jgi:hypothetical protein
MIAHRRSVRALLILAVVALSFVFLPLRQVEAATYYLGGVNLQSYCSWKYPYQGAQAVLVSNDAGGWRCKVGTVYFNISVDDTCKWQYGSWGYVWASTSNWSDPYSWRCYRYVE